MRNNTPRESPQPLKTGLTMKEYMSHLKRQWIASGIVLLAVTSISIGQTSNVLMTAASAASLGKNSITNPVQRSMGQTLGHVMRPGVDRHAEELKFRLLKLRDEKGQIPTNAWIKAAAQRKQMHFDPKAWAGRLGKTKPATVQASSVQISAASSVQTGSGGTISPLVAGVTSSGWSWLGPGNVGGRVRSILAHPTLPNTMWLGSVGGGIWKTTNGGSSWFPLDDFMANLAISCMVMDPANPDVIYAGTGEGFRNIDAIQGAGIFKTTNGGTTWAQLPSTATTDFLFVNRLAISPTNSLVILASTRTGIWRSYDGGGSWSLRCDVADVLDVAFDPTDYTKCIASGFSNVLYSLDGGQYWYTATGIPSGDQLKRIEVAYAPSSPYTVYASVERNGGELYSSADGGQSYVLVNTGTNYFGGDASDPGSEQGWYDNCLWVDPTNPNNLVLGGNNLWRSNDGGTNLHNIGGYGGGVHPDQHVIVGASGFNGITVKNVYVGNDGGIFKTHDIYSVSLTSGWVNVNNNLGITEFYGGAGNATSGAIIGGAQDNSTEIHSLGGGGTDWAMIPGAGGDGTLCAADPTDTNFFYYEYPPDGKTLYIEQSADGGGSTYSINAGIDDTNANWSAPFILDPNNPNTMLLGGENLWCSTNVKAWYPNWSLIKPPDNAQPISAIAVAPGKSDVIWIGHNNGDIFATANGTSANPTWIQINLGKPLPNRYCSRIAIDPHNVNQIYVTYGGFSSNNVWRTANSGASWTDISHNLPQIPVNSIVIAPHDSNYLYLGTEVGIYASSDGGTSWSPNNDGPANVVVDEIFWVGEMLVAATHGRGMYAIQPVVWVQFGLALPGNGTYDYPFNTLALGTNAVVPGGTIIIKSGTNSPETMTISKPMTIDAVGGTATIGK